MINKYVYDASRSEVAAVSDGRPRLIRGIRTMLVLAALAASAYAFAGAAMSQDTHDAVSRHP